MVSNDFSVFALVFKKDFTGTDENIYRQFI